MPDTSLRVQLFQRLTRLQIWLFARFLWYAFIVYLVTLVLFALLRLCTGISVKRIGYFCLRHIVFHPNQGVEIRIGRLGLFPHRPTVARPGFFSFVIANLEIHIDPVELAKQTGETGDESTENEDKISEKHSSGIDFDKFGMGDGVSLLPDPNSSAFKVVKWLVKHLKVFNLQLQGSSVVVHGVTSLICTSIFLRLDLRKTLNSKLSNFVGTLDSYRLSDGELPINAKLSVVDIYTAQSLEDEQPWQMFEDLRFDISGVLDVEPLKLKEFGVQVHSGRLQLDVKYLLDILKNFQTRVPTSSEDLKLPSEDVSSPGNIDEPKAKPSPADDKIKNVKLLQCARVLLQLVMRVQITIGFTEILQIPVSSCEDTAFLAMSMKDLNIDLSRMNSKNSGFRLSFHEDDYAHQAIFTFASFYAGLDDKNRQEEILYVPLVTSLTRTNITSQTLRLLSGETKHNHSKVITRAVIYSPHLTLEESQFPNLVRAALGMAAHFEKKPGTGLHEPPKQTENGPNFSFFPLLDIDVVVSNPATRIVCQQSNACKAALFVGCSSRVHMSVMAKHDPQSKSYRATLECDNYGTSITFDSTKTERLQLLAVQHTGFVAHLNSKPSLEIELELRQRLFRINAITHEVFYAIAQLHLSLREALKTWIAQHPNFFRRVREQRAYEKAIDGKMQVKKVGALRRVPSFITKVSVVATDSNVVVATNRFRGKTNDLLGIKATTENFDITYTRTKPKPYSPEVAQAEAVQAAADAAAGKHNTDHRQLTISASGFNVYKADHQLLSIDDKELPSTTSHSIVQLPKLSVRSHTLNKVETHTEVVVEPRLKVHLNINLILAFSVLREITDLLLLRHLKDSNQELEVDSAHQRTLPAHSHSLEHNTTILVFPRALIKIDMPSDDEVMFELNNGRVSVKHDKNPVLQAKAFRMYSQHPFQRSAWCVLMSMVELQVELNTHMDPKHEVPEDKVKLDVKGVRINVPYKFKLYRIIDNGITLVKAMRTLMLQTSTQDIMLVLRPQAIKKVPNIPRIRLKTAQLVLSIEDDYFESDLTLIMLTQRNAASLRRHKLYVLESRLKYMLRKGQEYLYSDERGHIASKRVRHFTTFNLASAFQLPKKRSTFHNHNQNSVTFQHNPEDEKERAIKEFMTNTSYASAPNTDESLPGVGNASGPNQKETNSKKSSSPSDATDETGKKEGTPKDGKAKEPPKKKQFVKEYQPKLSDEYIEAIARTLHQVPIEKINQLLGEGLELGLPCSDSDAKLFEGHAWLSFWADPDFAEFRKLRVPLQENGLGKLSVNDVREALLADFSRLWVDYMRNERMKQHLGVAKKRAQVFRDEFDKGTCREERIVNYSQKPLVMQVDFRDLDLMICKTEHGTREKLHKFIHDVGKGQPLNTEYSILVPMYLDLKAHGGLKVEVRDYPLPVLHFPPLSRTQDPKAHCALQIKGNLIISEQLISSEESIRKLFVPLKTLSRDLRSKRGSDVIEVNRTLTPIKTYTDLQFKSESTLPTRVCWCMAYKAGFSSVGEAFHGFSKPPVDPSPVLGFWDKIRLVLHGRFDFHLPKSPLALLMKAGRSPYGLQKDDSGFVFIWKDNVHVNINRNDDPKELFKFESEKFELLVPNYMEWEAEFLRASPSERAWPRQELSDKPGPAEKVVFSFNQHTVWKLGMSFERFAEAAGNDKLRLRSAEFRPHYDIKLRMPEYVKDEKNYDTYHGFRSDFIHMAISVISRPFSLNVDNLERENTGFEAGSSANRCTCHLSQKVLHHFSAWKDQFSSQHWPPIRLGSLFQAEDARAQPVNRTFGTALSTAVYQIALSPLDLSFFHEMRHRSSSENYDHTSGIKAKLDDLVFDWHTRREPPEVKDDEGNDVVELQGNRRWRMRSYLGEVSLQSVHVRVIKAKLRSTSSNAALRELQGDDEFEDDLSDSESLSDDMSSSDATSFYNSINQQQSERTTSSRYYGPHYVDNDYWIDLEDYTDIGCWRKHRSSHPHVKIYPFMYVPYFMYMRRTDFSGKAIYLDSKTGHIMPKFNDMMLHKCLLFLGPKAAMQNLLLKGRLEALEEQILNFKDSMESLASSDSGEMDKETQHKMRELQRMVEIAELNASILVKEIQHYTNAEHFECEGNRKYQKSMRESLDSHLGEYAPKKGTTVYEGEELDWKFGNLESSREKSYNDMMTFNNVYVMHAPHVRWNNSVRDVIYRLKSSLSEDKEIKYIGSQSVVQYLEELVQKFEQQSRDSMNGDAMGSERHASSGSSAKNLFFHPETGVTYINDKAHALQSQIAKPLKHVHTSHSLHHINLEKQDSDEEIEGPEEEGLTECGARLNHIYKDIQCHDAKYHTLQKSHSVSLIAPRFQLISEERPNDCLQMAARTLEMQVVDMYSKFGTTESENSRIERRIGAAVGEAGFFVMSREDLKRPAVSAICLEQYSGGEESSDGMWPPWLSIELCYNKVTMEQFMVLNDTSFGVQLYQPNSMHVASKEEERHRGVQEPSEPVELEQEDDKAVSLNMNVEESSEEAIISQAKNSNGDIPGITKDIVRTLRYHGKHCGNRQLTNVIIDAPHLVLNLDSKQFAAVYAIVTDLLTYTDPLTKKRDKAIDRVFLANDFREDIPNTLRNIELLQKDIRRLESLHTSMLINSLYKGECTRESRVLMIKLEREIFRRQTLLMVHIRAFKATLRRRIDSGWDKITKLSLLVDFLTARMLSEEGKPQMTLHVQRLHFARVSNEGSGSINRFTLEGIHARNNMPKAVYPQVLANYEDPRYAGVKDAFRAEWTNLDKVGGIPILECVIIRLKPLHLQLEHGVFEMLVDFVFPIRQKQQKPKKHPTDQASVHTQHAQRGEEGNDYSDDESDFSDDSFYDDTLSVQHDDDKLKRKSGLFKSLLPRRRKQKGWNSDVDEMVDRASNYMSIRSLVIYPTQIVASYKGKHRHALLNLQNLRISLPLFEVENRTWTKLELVMRIKHMIIKTLLAQSGSIIGNKFRLHKAHTAQDDRDLSLEQLGAGHSRWAREAAQIDDDLNRRDTGKAKPTAISQKHLVLDQAHADLLRPWHRTAAFVIAHEGMLKSTNTLSVSDDFGNYIARMPSREAKREPESLTETMLSSSEQPQKQLPSPSNRRASQGNNNKAKAAAKEAVAQPAQSAQSAQPAPAQQNLLKPPSSLRSASSNLSEKIAKQPGSPQLLRAPSQGHPKHTFLDKLRKHL